MKTAITTGIIITLIALVGIRVCAQNPPGVVVPNPNLVSPKIEGIYQGPWVTTKNKKLNGDANCEIKQTSKNRWQGRFWGVWQQVAFDYTVEFGVDTNEQKPRILFAREKAGKTAEVPVMGTATIDGASYEWKGQLSIEEFNIEFTGSRYEGSLQLKRVPDKKSETSN